MPHREATADYGVIFVVLTECLQIDDLQVFHLVDLQEIDELFESWQLTLGEAILLPSVIMDLRAVTPEEVFLWPFDQPCRVVTELGLLLLLPLFLHQFCPIL